MITENDAALLSYRYDKRVEVTFSVSHTNSKVVEFQEQIEAALEEYGGVASAVIIGIPRTGVNVTYQYEFWEELQIMQLCLDILLRVGFSESRIKIDERFMILDGTVHLVKE